MIYIYTYIHIHKYIWFRWWNMMEYDEIWSILGDIRNALTAPFEKRLYIRICDNVISYNILLSQHSLCKHGCSHSTIIDACIAAQLTIHIGTGAITAPSITCWMECQTCDVVIKCGCTLSAHPNNILSQHGTRQYYHSIACCFWFHVKIVV